MKRRGFLKTLASLPVAALTGCQYWPDEGLFSHCDEGVLPASLAEHDLVAATWEGIDTDQVWDCHAHLIGIGDSGSGIWVNPNMQSLLHPMLVTQFKYYLSATCAQASGNNSIDEGVVQRMLDLHRDMPRGFRFMLLAFDYYYDENGKPNLEYSAFHTPNDYARRLAGAHGHCFQWIASIHPYREDAVDALEWAAANNARAIKWLPSAMGIDASHPRCDSFYEAMVKHDLPLLAHTGAEYAVDVPSGQTYNNPLLFRRALDHGVKVIFAHCASLGKSRDIDKGENGPMVPSIELFARIMADHRHENLALGGFSAVTMVNRDREVIEQIVRTEEWHDRLVYGSDYPLPAVTPIFSPRNFVQWGMLPESEAEILSQVRRYNPMLFDVMLKRRISVDGRRIKSTAFETRRHFVRTSS
ncbi:MAG: amidohydrolase family protein [Gammaproteobacteria bacterium]|jgi:mannonate dehydratase